MSGRRSRKVGGQARGDLLAHHQFRQGLAPGDGLGVVPQQDAELVFLLADLALQVRDPGAGGVHQGVGLGHVLPGHHAPVVAQLDQALGGLEGFQGSLGDFQLAVQGAQLEVGPGHVGHHRGPHRPLGPLGGQGLGLGGFGQVPEAPEQVDLPEEVKVELGQAVHHTDPLRDGRVDAGLAQFLPLPQGGAAYLGEPQGAAHPHQGPGFGQPGHGLADIVVLRQRGADEVLEGRVAENLPPGEISQGVQLGPGLTLT